MMLEIAWDDASCWGEGRGDDPVAHEGHQFKRRGLRGRVIPLTETTRSRGRRGRRRWREGEGQGSLASQHRKCHHLGWQRWGLLPSLHRHLITGRKSTFASTSPLSSIAGASARHAKGSWQGRLRIGRIGVRRHNRQKQQSRRKQQSFKTLCKHVSLAHRHELLGHAYQRQNGYVLRVP